MADAAALVAAAPAKDAVLPVVADEEVKELEEDEDVVEVDVEEALELVLEDAVFWASEASIEVTSV